jgi:hypothetical protein
MVILLTLAVMLREKRYRNKLERRARVNRIDEVWKYRGVL